jgi:hypothetical protein
MTNEAKHTPGPWRLDGAIIRGFSTPDHERPICEIYRKVSVDAETLANANVLLAAPEMYDALKAIAWRRPGGLVPSELVRDIQVIALAALAKVEGGP